MKQYDLEDLKAKLKELDTKITPSERAIIAGFEQCSTVTVSTYLKGNITVPALADAIIDRANEILKKK